MPQVEDFPLLGPVGVLEPCCTMTSERTGHWTKMRRSLARPADWSHNVTPHSWRASPPLCAGLVFGTHTLDMDPLHECCNLCVSFWPCSIRQAEVLDAKRMIERARERFDLYPAKLLADSACGSAEMLGWLVCEHGIEPHLTCSTSQRARTAPFTRGLQVRSGR
jgi:hypothetical protein